jgi:hypothetical protein
MSKMGTNIQVINIIVEKEGNDYYELVLEVLEVLSDRLSGGHYEPKSERDITLSCTIRSLLATGILPKNY